MNKEIWKDIPGYDNKYQVSNFGNVRSVKRKKNLRLFKNNNGYMNVVLYKNSRKKHWRVHRLVAMTDRKSTRLNSSHQPQSRMPSSA